MASFGRQDRDSEGIPLFNGGFMSHFTFVNTNHHFDNQLPDLVYSREDRWFVVPEFQQWIYAELENYGMTLESYIGEYCRSNGMVRTIKLIRKLFNMDLRTAKNFVDCNYPEEKQQYWNRRKFRKSQEDFDKLINEDTSPIYHAYV
jgi:hypothetical protein